MQRFFKMSSLLLVAVFLFTACGNSNQEKSDVNTITLRNGLNVTKTAMILTDKYGDLKADESSAAFVISLQIENPTEKEQGFGTSGLKLVVDGKELSAELLTGGENPLRFFEKLAPDATMVGDAVFGVPASLATYENITLIFSNAIGDKQGELSLDVSTLIKEDNTPVVTNDNSGMITSEYGGMTLKASQAEILTKEEMAVRYPDMNSLERGYVFALVDVEITNHSGKETMGERNLWFSVIDEYDEDNMDKSVYTRYNLNGENLDITTALADGETRAGKIMFIIKDDVKELTLEWQPLYPEDKERIKIKVLG